MAKRSSINARAKKFERWVQQRLWPGSRFAGGAKRPALEDEDLRGPGRDGGEWFGECKNDSRETITGKGGEFAVLTAALTQCVEAIERTPEAWPNGVRPLPFAVLGPVGCRSEDRILAMTLSDRGDRIVMTLATFQEVYIGEQLLDAADL